MYTSMFDAVLASTTAGEKTDHSRSVRLLPLEEEADTPTPEQLAHARRMLVDCPSTGGKLHCWYRSRCSMASGCHLKKAEPKVNGLVNTVDPKKGRSR